MKIQNTEIFMRIIAGQTDGQGRVENIWGFMFRSEIYSVLPFKKKLL